jgi:hypothetical protein
MASDTRRSLRLVLSGRDVAGQAGVASTPGLTMGVMAGEAPVVRPDRVHPWQGSPLVATGAGGVRRARGRVRFVAGGARRPPAVGRRSFVSVASAAPAGARPARMRDVTSVAGRVTGGQQTRLGLVTGAASRRDSAGAMSAMAALTRRVSLVDLVGDGLVAGAARRSRVVGAMAVGAAHPARMERRLGDGGRVTGRAGARLRPARGVRVVTADAVPLRMRRLRLAMTASAAPAGRAARVVGLVATPTVLVPGGDG